MKQKSLFIAVVGTLVAACATASYQSHKDGLVEYIGAQKEIIAKNKVGRAITLDALGAKEGLYALGPVEGLDGEITVFNGKTYVSQVRGETYTVDHTDGHGAIFLAWTRQTQWRDVPVPDTVRSYLDLQSFVKTTATEAGINTSAAFPFQLVGVAAEVKWHININRTDGKPVTKELFTKSKEMYLERNQPVDIIGFYSENHPGIFIGQSAPGIKPGSSAKNSIHIHFVSRADKATGHIDDLTLGTGMTLRLPKL